MKLWFFVFLTSTLMVGSLNVSAQDASPLHMDGDGFVLRWEKRFTPRPYGEAEIYGLTHAPDGGIYVAGNIDASNEEGRWGFSADAFIKRLDGAGNIIWQKTLGGLDEYDGFNALAPMPDGGVVWDVFYTAAPAPGGGVYLAGETVQEDEDGDGWALHLDKDGNILGEHRFGGGQWNHACG